MKYGVFGGSFDPPHQGHLYVARSARERLGLDTVLWVPAPDPPHKARPGTPFADRLAMVRLAIRGQEGHEASDIEASLPAPSYTLNTLRALKVSLGADHAWHLIIGADNWEIFPTWHRPGEVLREATLVVFPRGGRPLDDLPPGVLRLDLPEMDVEARGIRADLGAVGGSGTAGLLPVLRPYVLARGLYGTSSAEARQP